jgi:hypothetical protein
LFFFGVVYDNGCPYVFDPQAKRLDTLFAEVVVILAKFDMTVENFLDLGDVTRMDYIFTLRDVLDVAEIDKLFLFNVQQMYDSVRAQ